MLHGAGEPRLGSDGRRRSLRQIDAFDKRAHDRESGPLGAAFFSIRGVSEKQIYFAVAPADKIASQARCRNRAYGEEVAAELNWSGRRESNPHGQLGRLELYH